MGQQFSSHQDENDSNSSNFIHTLTQQQRNRPRTKLPPPRDNKKTLSKPNNTNPQQQREFVKQFKKIESIYEQSTYNNTSIDKNDWREINQHVAEIERLSNQEHLSLPLNPSPWTQQLENIMSTLIMSKPQHIKAIILLNKLGITFETTKNEHYHSAYYAFCIHYIEQYNAQAPMTKEHKNSLLNNILSSLIINEQGTLLASDMDSGQEWINLGHGIRWTLPFFMIVYKADVSRVPEELLQSLEDNYFHDLAQFIRTIKEMDPNKRSEFLADLKLQLLEASKSIREIPQISPKQYITFFACLKDKSITEKAPLQRALYRNLNKVMKHHCHEALRHDETTMMMNLFFNYENHDLIINTIKSSMDQQNQLPNRHNN